MKKIFISFIILWFFFSCSKNETKSLTSDDHNLGVVKSDTLIPSGLKKLLKAYPDFLDSADFNHLYWKDGTVMIYDDGKEKTFEEMLDNPDLEDMFKIEYIPGKDYENPPPMNYDPGRIRYEPFFKKIYGSTQNEVKNKLVTVDWMPESSRSSIIVTSVNGVDAQFRGVSLELDKLEEKFKKYVTKTAGTFNWRVIAGTNRMSAHSYGIAIDINTAYSDYWLWSKSYNYNNKIPIEIVLIFEKYGFIWGGKWYHYDTMHFEYRPELFETAD